VCSSDLISKLATAIGFMQLVESGKVDLDADVSRYFGTSLRNPAFPGQTISARMLLSHTSSLRDESDLLLSKVGVRLEDVLYPAAASGSSSRCWAREARQAPARRYFAYANINFVVLGTLIERVSGLRFDRYMTERVFAPLGLRASFNPAQDFAPAELDQLATLYRKSPDQGRTWAPAGPWVPQGPDRTGTRASAIEGLESYRVGNHAGVFGPQGSLRTSVRGLGALMRLMLGKGSLHGVQILRPATVEAMLTPQWTFNGKPEAPNGDTYHGLFFAWGLGPQLFTGRGGPPGQGDRIGAATGGLKGAGHLGEAYGLLSGLVFDPATRHGMAYILGGISDDPGRYLGHHSAFSGWEESALGAMWRGAVAGPVR
jgi:CubicO group peptidase (beta-lactamase class C family)